MDNSAAPGNNSIASKITAAGKGKSAASSWAHSVLDEKGGLILVTSTTTDGQKAFYFLLLARPQRNDLIYAMESRSQLNLEEFGRIVHSGWGEPAEADKAYMREHFNAAF